MASRTDQLQSYQFRTRRVLAALVMRETDPPQSPLRRGVGAIFGGVMLSVLVAAGFGIYGLVTKVGGDDWRQHGSVIVERETGASYVYLNGTLYPTLNLASAMLAANQTGSVHRVSSKSLSEVPRGNIIGIPGAPDSLPPADRAIGLPWTVCTRAEETGSPTVARVYLDVGGEAHGGVPLEDRGLLVRDTGPGRIYLVVEGRRHLIADPQVVPAVFGALTDPVEVGAAWINALPAGRDIGRIEVERAGLESSTIQGYRNGDIVAHPISGGGLQHYLVLDDGVAPLSPLQVDVLRAYGSVEPMQVGSEVALHRSPSAPPSSNLDPPQIAPELAEVGPGEAVCATAAGAPNAPESIVTPPTVRVGATVDAMTRGTRTPGTAGNAALADSVLVPGGRVAIVHATPVVQRDPEVRQTLTGSYLVVTDLGIAYPLPDASVLPLLGYSPGMAIDVPASLAGLIPLGPALDPAAAIQNAVLP